MKIPVAVSIPQPTPDFDIEEYLAKVTTPVAADDLRKIILFDVAYEKIKDDEVRFETFENPLYVPIPRIKGRLRNELPGKICRLKLSISFFNSDGKLIETEPVTVNEVFYPGGPTSFSGGMKRSLNLPEGWTWKVTVSDAYYTKDEN